MKLEIGIPNYRHRSMGEIGGMKIKGRMPGRDVPIILVTAEKMADLHETLPNVRGCPRYCAFDVKKQEVWMHPTPDGEYIAEILPGKQSQPEKSTTTITLPKKA